MARAAAYYATAEARGEICLVVGPAPVEETGAVASVAEATGLKRRDVYRRALELGEG